MKRSSADHHVHHALSDADRLKISEGAARLATRRVKEHRHGGRARSLDHGIGDHPASHMSGAGLDIGVKNLHGPAVPKVVEHIRRRAASDDGI